MDGSRENLGCTALAFIAVLLLASCAGTPREPAVPVERGAYLVESILACGNCHTPKTPTGEPVAALNLSGGGLRFSPPPFVGVASNITPDRETGIGAWTDAEIKRAIVEGVRPGHGRLPGVPLAVVMAVPFFKALTPTDLDAVVAYLRAVPPIRQDWPAPTYRAPQTHQPYPDAEAGFKDERMNDPVYRGRYLVTVAHCMECHTPFDKGQLDFARLGGGGRLFSPAVVQGFPADWTGARPPNITPHPTRGIGAWTDDEIKRAITQGISRNGRKLGPPMGFAYYAKLRPADLDAIVKYLRTLPPVE